MPLISDSSDEAFNRNVAAERRAGKRRDVALAIAYRIKREASAGKKGAGDMAKKKRKARKGRKRKSTKRKTKRKGSKRKRKSKHGPGYSAYLRDKRKLIKKHFG